LIQFLFLYFVLLALILRCFNLWLELLSLNWTILMTVPPVIQIDVKRLLKLTEELKQFFLSPKQIVAIPTETMNSVAD